MGIKLDNRFVDLPPEDVIEDVKQADGSGSGLDADTVDGLHASNTPEPNKLLALDSAGKIPLEALPTGSGASLDADTVDGLHGGQFIRSDSDDIFTGTLTWDRGSGIVLKFDSDIGYAKWIAINDGTGNFTLKHNWSNSNTYITSNIGAARISLDCENATPYICLSIASTGTAGSAISNNHDLHLWYDGRITWDGNTIWHAGNDGSGSGLDADLLDGLHASSFALTDLSNVSNTSILTKLKSVDGSGSGLDADTVDGFDTSQTSSPNVIIVSNSQGKLDIGWIDGYTNRFRNRIINGDFAIWQRGTSASYVGGGYKTADRMYSGIVIAGGQFTVSKSEINGFNAIRFTVDTPPTDLTSYNCWFGLTYVFEGQHLYDLVQKKANVTISFLFRSNVTGEFSLSMVNATTFLSLASYVTAFDYTTAGTVQKVEVTIPLDYTWSEQPRNDNLKGFELRIGALNQGDYVASTTNTWIPGVKMTTPDCVNWGSATGNYWEIAQLQLEEGEVATEFEYVPFDVQLMRCQRYFFSTLYPHFDVNSLENAITTHAYSSVDFYQRTYELPVDMRSRPSVTTYAFASGSRGFIRDSTTNSDVAIDIGSETSARQVYFLSRLGSLVAGHLYSWHFECEAEL